MSDRASPLGSGLYFIDVLACLLFCLSLALVGARFGSEHTALVEVPDAEPARGTGPELSGWQVRVEGEGEHSRIVVDGESLSLAAFEARLRAMPPPAVVIYSEATALARVIASAHAAGVHDVELAYEARKERR